MNQSLYPQVEDRALISLSLSPSLSFTHTLSLSLQVEDLESKLKRIGAARTALSKEKDELNTKLEDRGFRFRILA